MKTFATWAEKALFRRGPLPILPTFMALAWLWARAGGETAFTWTPFQAAAGTWVSIHVATNGNDGDPGTYTAPLATVQGGLNALNASNLAGWNVKLILKDGIHRPAAAISASAVLNPALAVVVQAENSGQAVIRGSSPFTNWSPRGGGLHAHPWTNDWGFMLDPSGYNFFSSGVENAYVAPLARRCEWFFQDGVPLRPVLHRSGMMPGTFWVDEGADEVLAWGFGGEDLSSASIEGNALLSPNSSNGSRALISLGKGRKNWLFQGLVFDRAGGVANAPLRILDGTNLAFVDCVFATNQWHGVETAGSVGLLFSNCTFIHAGENGLTAGQDDGVTELWNCRILSNGWRISRDGDQWGWNAAAFKPSGNRILVRDSLIAGNWTHGLWFDVDCRSNLVSNCTIVSNGGIGIFSEINRGPVDIDACTIGWNGWNADTTFGMSGAGVYLMGGVDTRVRRSTLMENEGTQIGANAGVRTVLDWHSAEYSNFLPLRAERLTLISNRISGRSGQYLFYMNSTGMLGEGTNGTNFMSTLTAGTNVYWNPDNPTPFLFARTTGALVDPGSFADLTNEWPQERTSFWGEPGLATAFTVPDRPGTNLAAGNPFPVTIAGGGASLVALRLNGTNLGSLTPGPFAWTLSNLSPGIHRLEGSASDATGRSVRVSTWIQVTQGGPVARWRLDEGSGTNLADGGGNGAAATLIGGRWLSNLTGAMQVFEGSTNDGIRYGGGLLGSESGTFTAWLLTATNLSNVVNAPILFYGAHRAGLAAGAPRHLRLVVTSGAVHGRLRFEVEYSTNTAYFDNNVSINDGRWHHVAVTWDRTLSNRIYVDGMLTGSRRAYSNQEVEPFLLEQDTFVSGLLTTGRQLPGTYDEIALWNRPLGPEEVLAECAAGSNRLAASPCWPFTVPPPGTRQGPWPAVSLSATGHGGAWSLQSASGPFTPFGTNGVSLVFSNTTTLWAFGSNGGLATPIIPMTFVVDQAPPQVSASHTQWVTNAVMTATLMVTGGTGFWAVKPDTNWSRFDSNQAVRADGLWSNGRTVWYYGQDASGNVTATNEMWLKVESRAPSFTVSPSQSLSTNQAFSVTLAVDESDLFWKTNGGPWQSMVQGTNSVGVSETTTLLVFARDQAGNVTATNTLYYEVSPPSTNLLTGRVLYARMEEKNGTLRDTSPFGNHALSNLMAWSNGRQGQSGLFNGTTTQVFIPDSPSLDLANDLSLAAWFRTTNGAQTGALIAKNDSPGVYELRLQSSNFTLALKNAATNFGGNSPKVAVGDDRWHFVVAVREGSNVRFALDGTNLAPATAFSGGFLSGSLTNTADALRIGNRRPGSTHWDGRIDDVMVYNRALSAGEVSNLYTNLPPEVFSSPETNLLFTASNQGVVLEASVPNGRYSTNGGSAWVSFNFRTNVILPPRASLLFQGASPNGALGELKTIEVCPDVPDAPVLTAPGVAQTNLTGLRLAWAGAPGVVGYDARLWQEGSPSPTALGATAALETNWTGVAEATWRLASRASNALGQVSPWAETTVTLDRTAPRFTVVAPRRQASSTVALEISTSDGTIGSWRLAKDGEAPGAWGDRPTQIEIGAGDHAIVVWAMDRSGNTAAVTNRVENLSGGKSVRLESPTPVGRSGSGFVIHFPARQSFAKSIRVLDREGRVWADGGPDLRLDEGQGEAAWTGMLKGNKAPRGVYLLQLLDGKGAPVATLKVFLVE